MPILNSQATQLNLLDAAQLEHKLAAATYYASRSSGDTAKLYVIYMLYTKLGMDVPRIVRSLECTKKFVMRSLDKFREYGMIDDNGSAVYLHRDAIRKIVEPRYRMIAIIEAAGKLMFTINYARDIGQLDYFVARSILETMAKTKLITRVGLATASKTCRSVVYLNHHVVTHIAAVYECRECSNRMSVTVPSGCIIGAEPVYGEPSRLRCVVCDNEEDPANMFLVDGVAW